MHLVTRAGMLTGSRSSVSVIICCGCVGFQSLNSHSYYLSSFSASTSTSTAKGSGYGFADKVNLGLYNCMHILDFRILSNRLFLLISMCSTSTFRTSNNCNLHNQFYKLMCSLHLSDCRWNDSTSSYCKSIT